MAKLFEFRIYKNTEEPVPLCWKVLASLFTASIFLAMAVVCNSCQGEDVERNVVEEGHPATIRVEVQAEEEVDIATRAVDETVISNLHILIYNSLGELIGQKYQTGSASIIVSTTSASNCTIYAIANTGKADLFKGYDIHQESYLKSMMYSMTNWDDLMKGTGLPMTGNLKNVNIKSGKQTVSTPLKLTRMVAKIMLNIGVKPSSGITITNFKIYNLPKNSNYIPGTADASTTWLSSGSIGASSATTAGTTFYMFENRRGIKSGITQQKDKNSTNAPANATYVEINGTQGGVVTAKWIVYLGENSTTDFNIKRNGKYTYKITLNDAAVTDTRVTLAFGGVEDLSAAGTSNCYLASKTNTWYKFKATVRGNGAATAADISPTGAALAAKAVISPVSAELVWETGGHGQIIQGIMLRDGYTYFKTGATAEGNAVVSVKDKSGTILWSWHIWKTSFGLAEIPTQSYLTKPRSGMNGMIYSDIVPASRTLIMMDRDLGASSSAASNADDVVKTFGLYYQFGRKDPFPTAKNRERRIDNNSEIVDVFNSNGTKLSAATLRGVDYQVKNSTISTSVQPIISYSIKHPLTFILWGNDVDCNWIYGSQAQSEAWKASNKLWGGNLNSVTSSKRLDTNFNGKTIYDPCPTGWCMPPQDTWTNFTTSLLDGDRTSNYNIKADAGLYNCPAADKKDYTDGNNMGFVSSTSVFGRRYYISGKAGATAFHSASGYRNGANGYVSGVGESSYLWSSSPVSADLAQSACLNAGINWIYPVSSHNRANGFPVRCVKESSLK